MCKDLWIKIKKIYRMKMEFEGEEPLSPTGQYLSSSVLCLTIFGFLEFQVPIHDLQIFSLLKDLFLPINPRFSSIMICDKTGSKKWKRVEVDLQQHVKIPTFPKGKSPQVYHKYLDEYVSNMTMLPLPQTRPLWEVHVIKYQTSNAAGTLIFKLHHALGDGYSLIGALLSTLKRADNPSLPLTFPSRRSTSKLQRNTSNKFLNRVTKVFPRILDTMLDFGNGLLRGNDDQTPIRSGDEGVEFRPINYTTLTFSLDNVKQIKDSLKVTVNDLIMGIILYGSRVYMEREKHKSRKAASTALLAFSIRDMRNHSSVSQMLKHDSTMPWGNHFTFSDVAIPKLKAKYSSSSDLQNFVLQVHKATKRKKNSAAVYLNASFIDTVRKCRGSEAAARYIYSRMKKSSVILSNLIGPVEQMALADHPIKGLYFTGSGAPVSVAISVVSYMGNLKVAVGSERGFIDQNKLKLCIQEAYDTISSSGRQSK